MYKYYTNGHKNAMKTMRFKTDVIQKTKNRFDIRINRIGKCLLKICVQENGNDADTPQYIPNSTS